MSDEKLRGAIGLAMRAGKCISGREACLSAIKANSAKLIIIDDNASKNTYDEWSHISDIKRLRLITLKGLDWAIGRPDKKIAVITDNGFVKMIESLLKIDN